jgi:D-lactate dehydratase
MSGKLPRRALIACTSATAPLHNGNPTGLFISEALHPYQVFTEAGFEVDIASEKGTWVADWLSLQPDFLNGKDKEQYEDTNSDFRRKLDNMPDVKSLNGKDVRISHHVQWLECSDASNSTGFSSLALAMRL